MNTAVKVLGVGVLVAGIGYFVKAKVDDASSQIKLFITGFRVHGIVNGTFLRFVIGMRMVNNSTVTITPSNINSTLKIKDSTGTFTEVGFIPDVIPNIPLKAGQSFTKEVNFDVNLLSLGAPLWNALKSGTISYNIVTAFYVAGLRQEIPAPGTVTIPSFITALLSVFNRNKEQVAGIGRVHMLQGPASQQINQLAF